MKLQINFATIAAFLAGAAAIAAAITGIVPEQYADTAATVGALLTGLAVQFGDSDGDGVPNFLDHDGQPS